MYFCDEFRKPRAGRIKFSIISTESLLYTSVIQQCFLKVLHVQNYLNISSLAHVNKVETRPEARISNMSHSVTSNADTFSEDTGLQMEG